MLNHPPPRPDPRLPIRCEKQSVPVIFALTRKRLGQIYGCRKRVSAVALLDFQGIEELHDQLVALMQQGCAAWKKQDAAGGAGAAAAAAAAGQDDDECEEDFCDEEDGEEDGEEEEEDDLDAHEEEEEPAQPGQLPGGGAPDSGEPASAARGD